MIDITIDPPFRHGDRSQVLGMALVVQTFTFLLSPTMSIEQKYGLSRKMSMGSPIGSSGVGLLPMSSRCLEKDHSGGVVEVITTTITMMTTPILGKCVYDNMLVLVASIPCLLDMLG